MDHAYQRDSDAYLSFEQSVLRLRHVLSHEGLLGSEPEVDLAREGLLQSEPDVDTSQHTAFQDTVTRGLTLMVEAAFRDAEDGRFDQTVKGRNALNKLLIDLSD